ncbi:EF-hand domain-containing protein [Mesorhizobium sp. KR9-304]|uniref:EF-hand domain-containing protein n=1 Tax=Mesorhizobium sp. KR9-304 TaxID=3156614 RepID=UPI0032B5065F
MKTASVAFATMVLAAATITAAAQPFQGLGPMGRIDANQDGQITKEEAAAARARLFTRLDKNGDGLVEEAEIDVARQAIIDRATMMEARLSLQWQRLDKDGDGKVSAAEFQSHAMFFDLADRNGDGTVGKDEIELLRGLFGRDG